MWYRKTEMVVADSKILIGVSLRQQVLEEEEEVIDVGL
jgi:hypothetical protein